MPTFVHGKSTRVLIGEQDMTGFFRESTMSTEIEMAETSCYGNTYKTYMPGKGSAKLDLRGLYDGALNAVDAKLTSLFQTANIIPVTLGLGGLAEGDSVFAMPACEQNYDITSPFADVVNITTSFTSDVNGGSTGRSLKALSSVGVSGLTATGADGGVAPATPSLDGAFALLHVTANDRNTGTLAVRIQHSVDNTTYVDTTPTMVFTTVNAGALNVGAYQVVLPEGASLNRYVKAIWTVTGGTTGGYTFHVNFVRH